MKPTSDSLYFEWPQGLDSSDLEQLREECPDVELETLREIGAVSTTRQGGFSSAPYDSFNLGYHVGDDDSSVRINRQRLAQLAGDDVQFCWIEQVHGTEVAQARNVAEADGPVEADACISFTPGLACAVLTADCLPVLLADKSASVVGAAHAGWRGLAAGVLEQTVEAMATDPADIGAWLGPAIGPEAFEVGDDVLEAFTEDDPGAEDCFEPSPQNPDDRWVADLYALARRRLLDLGIGHVTGGEACTYSDDKHFFSYRRDGTTGRMATAIWLRKHVSRDARIL